MKRNIKRMLGLSLAFTLFVLAIGASGIAAIESRAAGSGAWILESHDVKYSGYSGYTSGGYEVEKYIMNSKYDEESSKIIHYVHGSDYGNYTWDSCDFIATCMIPPAKIPGDSKVTLPISLKIENSGLTNSVYGELQYRAEIIWDRLSDNDGYRYFASETDEDKTMLSVFTVYYPNKQSCEDTFSCIIPSGVKNGEKAEFVFWTNNYEKGVVKTIITYTWSSSASASGGQSSDTAQIDKSIKAPAKISGIKAKKKGNGCTISWKKTSKNCKGYEIQVATDKKFKNNVKSVMVSGKNKKSGKVTGLNKNTTYYSRVRAYNKSAKGYRYGKWSKITKFKTGK